MLANHLKTRRVGNIYRHGCNFNYNHSLGSNRSRYCQDQWWNNLNRSIQNWLILFRSRYKLFEFADMIITSAINNIAFSKEFPNTFIFETAMGSNYYEHRTYGSFLAKDYSQTWLFLAMRKPVVWNCWTPSSRINEYICHSLKCAVCRMTCLYIYTVCHSLCDLITFSVLVFSTRKISAMFVKPIPDSCCV